MPTSGIMISGCDLDPSFLHLAGRLDDRARLHGGDLGIDDAQPAAAEAQHRVELVQVGDLGGDLLGGDAHRRGHLAAWSGVVVRQELVQRRVEQCGWSPGGRHRPEDADEVAPLERQQLGQGGFAVRRTSSARIIWRTVDDAVAAEEHVLGAAQADALGAERDGVARRSGCRRWCGPSACGTRRPSFMSLAYCWNVRLSGFSDLLVQHLDDLGGLVLIWPTITSPVKPSMVMQSPSLTTCRRP